MKTFFSQEPSYIMDTINAKNDNTLAKNWTYYTLLTKRQDPVFTTDLNMAGYFTINYSLLLVLD